MQLTLVHITRDSAGGWGRRMGAPDGVKCVFVCARRRARAWCVRGIRRELFFYIQEHF